MSCLFGPIEISTHLVTTDERRRTLLEWLSPDDFEEIHERQVNKRCKNTGQWLLDDPRFLTWRDASQSSILRCHGACRLQLCIHSVRDSC